MSKPSEPQRGFALLMVFLLAAAIAISLYMELPRVAFETQRSRELLTVDRGLEYQRAIQLFVRATKRYPTKIEDLENFNDKRFLRHRYIDPLTGKDDWRFIHVGPTGMLTDSLVKKNNNPLGGKDDKDANKDQQASGTDPNATPGGDPNAPTGGLNLAKARRPGDVMAGQLPPMGSTGVSGAAGTDPVQQAGYPPQYPPQPQYPQPGQTYPAQYPPQYPGQQVPGQPQYPGQPVQPYPGQPAGTPSYPGQPVPGQQFPQPGQLPYPALPGQPYPQQVPGQPVPGQPYPTVQPGQTFPGQQYPGQQYPGQQVPGQPTYPGQPSPYPGQPSPYPTQPTPAIPTTAVPQAVKDSILGGSSSSAFSNPQPGGGMGGGIAGVGIPAAYKGEGIMRIKDRSKYREWEFIYDPKEDKNIVGAAGAQQNQQALQNPLGPQTPPQQPQQPPQQPPQQ